MSGNGWIKLHRGLRQNPFYTNSVAIHCWIECLLRASHTKRQAYLKREKIEIEPGMFVMGREEFGRSVGVSGSTIWYWLLQFESDSMIDIKKTAKGSVVSIRNWSHYQGVDSTSDNKKTADEQQMNTNKNEKNERMKRNTPPTPQGGAFEKFWDAYPRKVGKGAAEKSWKRIKPTPELIQQILSAIEEQKASTAWTKDNGQFIPHPTTWLNQKRWEDENQDIAAGKIFYDGKYYDPA